MQHISQVEGLLSHMQCRHVCIQNRYMQASIHNRCPLKEFPLLGQSVPRQRTAPSTVPLPLQTPDRVQERHIPPGNSPSCAVNPTLPDKEEPGTHHQDSWGLNSSRRNREWCPRTLVQVSNTPDPSGSRQCRQSKLQRCLPAEDGGRQRLPVDGQRSFWRGEERGQVHECSAPLCQQSHRGGMWTRSFSTFCLELSGFAVSAS